jgi:glutaconate CoA-transferase subunit A
LDRWRDRQGAGRRIPLLAQGYYKRDNAFYISWDKIARERETFLAWMKANVLEQGPDVFAKHVQRAKAA